MMDVVYFQDWIGWVSLLSGLYSGVRCFTYILTFIIGAAYAIEQAVLWFGLLVSAGNSVLLLNCSLPWQSFLICCFCGWIRLIRWSLLVWFRISGLVVTVVELYVAHHCVTGLLVSKFELVSKNYSSPHFLDCDASWFRFCFRIWLVKAAVHRHSFSFIGFHDYILLSCIWTLFVFNFNFIFIYLLIDGYYWYWFRILLVHWWYGVCISSWRGLMLLAFNIKYLQLSISYPLVSELLDYVYTQSGGLQFRYWLVCCCFSSIVDAIGVALPLTIYSGQLNPLLIFPFS